MEVAVRAILEIIAGNAIGLNVLLTNRLVYTNNPQLDKKLGFTFNRFNCLHKR